jgi:hypothetical protein
MPDMSEATREWYEKQNKVLITKFGEAKIKEAVKKHCGSCGRKGGTVNRRRCQGFPLQEDGSRCAFWKPINSQDKGGCC